MTASIVLVATTISRQAIRPTFLRRSTITHEASATVYQNRSGSVNNKLVYRPIPSLRNIDNQVKGGMSADELRAAFFTKQKKGRR